MTEDVKSNNKYDERMILNTAFRVNDKNVGADPCVRPNVTQPQNINRMYDIEEKQNNNINFTLKYVTNTL